MMMQSPSGTHRRGMGVALLVLVVSICSSGCGDDDGVGDAAVTGDTSAPMAGALPALHPDCDPIGGACGLPFPSNVYLEGNADTPSGMRLRFGVGTLPVLNGGDPIDPTVYEDIDGFSPASSPMVLLRGATASGLATWKGIDRSLVDDSPTVILHAQTGERVAHWAEIDRSGTDDDRVLLLRPAALLETSTRYIVAIRGVVNDSGEAVASTDAFVALRDGTGGSMEGVSERRAYYDDLFATLEAAGVARDDLQVAWDFTTGSREGITGRMIGVRDAALAAVGEQGPEFTVTSVEDAPNPNIKHRVLLNAKVPMFVPSDVYEDGDPVPVFTFDDNGQPTQQGMMDVEVLIQIPNSVDDGRPLGILQNAHGFFGSKEEGRDGYLATIADEYGYVTVVIDLFGFRGEDVLVAAEGLTSRPEIAPGFVDRQIQGMVNQLVIMRMMIGRVASEGLTAPDGRELITPSQIDRDLRFYRGDSQGGIMGATYMAVSTDVTRGLLGEPALGYSRLWTSSVDSMQYSSILRGAYSSDIDFQLMLQLIQLFWDRSEPSGFAPYIGSNSLPGTPSHRVLLHTAIGDPEVPTRLAHVLARSLGAGLLQSSEQDVAREVYGLPRVSAPTANGSVLVEYDFGLPPEPIINIPATAECNPHDRVRTLLPSFEQQDTFFRTGEFLWFCDGACNCDSDGEELGCLESLERECGN